MDEQTETPVTGAEAPGPMVGPSAALGGISKITLLTPAAVNVVRMPDAAGPGVDGWKLEFLISPFEVVAVQFDDEARAGLVKELTGGITIARPGDLAGIRA